MPTASGSARINIDERSVAAAPKLPPLHCESVASSAFRSLEGTGPALWIPRRSVLLDIKVPTTAITATSWASRFGSALFSFDTFPCRQGNEISQRGKLRLRGDLKFLHDPSALRRDVLLSAADFLRDLSVRFSLSQTSQKSLLSRAQMLNVLSGLHGALPRVQDSTGTSGLALR